jgi:hypothetical protein
MDNRYRNPKPAEEIIELSRFRVVHRGGDRKEVRFFVFHNEEWVCAGHIDAEIHQEQWQLLGLFVRALFPDPEVKA